MKKYIITAVIALTTILITSSAFISCKRIGAGHEGILVNLYGSETGVNDVSYVYGYVFYNPFTQSIYEYPTYVQTTDYPAFEVYAKDGLLFTVEPTISLKVIDGQAAPIFKKYRKDLPDIINGPLFNQVRETFKSPIISIFANFYRKIYEIRCILRLIKCDILYLYWFVEEYLGLFLKLVGVFGGEIAGSAAFRALVLNVGMLFKILL